MKFFNGLLLLMFSYGLCDECVTYNFENDFDTMFSSDTGICAGIAFTWTLENFESLGLDIPHPLSSMFISPSTAASCVSSFQFPMPSGTLQINVFTDNMQTEDNINVMMMDSSGGIILNSVYNLAAPNYVPGWNTLEISVGAPSGVGFIVLMGSASVGSTVLVDSFRYIPPLLDENSDECVIYRENDNPPSTNGPEESTTEEDTSTTETQSWTTDNTVEPTDSTVAESSTTESNDQATESTLTDSWTTDSDNQQTDSIVPDSSTTDTNDQMTNSTVTESSTTDGSAQVTDSTVTDSWTTDNSSQVTDSNPTESSTTDSSDQVTDSTPTESSTTDNSGQVTVSTPTESSTTDSTAQVTNSTVTDSWTSDNSGQVTDSTPTESSTLDSSDQVTDSTATESSTTDSSAQITDSTVTDSWTTDSSGQVTDSTATESSTTDSSAQVTDSTVTDSWTTDNHVTDSTETDTGTTIGDSTTGTEPDDSGQDVGSPTVPDESGFWNTLTISMVVMVSAIFLGLICMVFYYLGKSKAEKMVQPVIIPEVDYNNLPKTIKVPRVHSVYSDASMSPYRNSALQV